MSSLDILAMKRKRAEKGWLSTEMSPNTESGPPDEKKRERSKAILAAISPEQEETAGGHAPTRALLAKAVGRLFTHPLESTCDSLFVFYSLWTLSWIVCYFANLSFSVIWPIFFLLPPVS